MPEFVPCLLERKLVAKPWGGRALASLFGNAMAGPEPIGETWEVFDRPAESSRLRGSDVTLHDLMHGDPQALLGRGVDTAAGDRFPLAVKFVDAAQALSVQVHPDDAQAASAGDSGKAEAWVVVHAGPQACIRSGFREGVTREQFAELASTESVLELLATFTPKVGDVVHVPAGTVHTIGPDVVVYEIQQNSDITYRLWDWGRPREMHVAAGLRAARLRTGAPLPTKPAPIGRGAEWCVRDPRFRLRRFRQEEPAILGTEGSFKLVTLLRGQATLGWRSGGRDEPLRLLPGDTALVPACAGAVFLSPIGSAELLVADAGEGR